MAIQRRPAEVSVHDWHHKIIGDRVDEFFATKRSKRYVRREAEKKATWALRTHLIGEHHLRNLGPFLNLVDLHALHLKDHT